MLTTGAEKVAVTDPHGFTLTVISVSVVFAALLILYAIYSFSGAVFGGKVKKPTSKRCREAEVAAAIALALNEDTGDEKAAAIAAALQLYRNDYMHDTESGVLTINNSDSAWGEKGRNFRKTNRR